MAEFVVEFGKDGRPVEPDGRLDAPAFHRNHQPIWSVLGKFLDSKSGDILEAGSGTGQHVIDYARRSPQVTWWPSDFNDAHLKSIVAWRTHAQLPNVRVPMRIDLSDSAWCPEMLDGNGPAEFAPPNLGDWPETVLERTSHAARRVNLDQLSKKEMESWHAGEIILLSGRLLTGRDAAHARIAGLLARGESLPVDFNGRVIYYVGPVDAVREETVGPAGPTTATRMDKFTEMMLAQTGLIAMIGKAERGPVAIEAIRKHKSAYLMAVGGAAYLVARAIRGARVVGFADLGMEAIYEFDVKDMPVTVAVDANGTSVHQTGPKEWQAKIGRIAVATA